MHQDRKIFKNNMYIKVRKKIFHKNENEQVLFDYRRKIKKNKENKSNTKKNSLYIVK
jgi:hypothetical protein